MSSQDQEFQLSTLARLDDIDNRIASIENRIKIFLEELKPYLEQVAPVIASLETSPIFRMMTGTGKKK